VPKIKLNFTPMYLTTAYPFGISYGTTSTITNILVTLEWDRYEGLGEAAPAHYHNETPATVEAVLSQWQKDELLGDDPFAICEMSARMDRSVAGNFSAKAAVEMALHDLSGQITQQPTWRMLGLSGLAKPATDFTIGIDTLLTIEKKTREALEAGWRTLKVKQGTPYDREIIATIRAVAPEVTLRVDANGAWTAKQAVEMSEFLADNKVEFIEQPLPKYAHVKDFQFVRERSPLPIFADESVGRAADVVRLAGAIDGVVVKLAKSGGILEAFKMIAAARAHGMQIMFGCMIESSLGVTAAAQLQGLVDYLDLDGALLLRDDPFAGVIYDQGYLHLPEKPGLGVQRRD